jgi:hypothetical protein
VAELHPNKDWIAVAAMVGHGVTNEQCSTRWRKHISPEAVARKQAKGIVSQSAAIPWTEEEVFVSTKPPLPSY